MCNYGTRKKTKKKTKQELLRFIFANNVISKKLMLHMIQH